MTTQIKKGPGRPLLTTQQKVQRSSVASILCTPIDRRIIKAAADLKGLTIGEYLSSVFAEFLLSEPWRTQSIETFFKKRSHSAASVVNVQLNVTLQKSVEGYGFADIGESIKKTADSLGISKVAFLGMAVELKAAELMESGS